MHMVLFFLISLAPNSDYLPVLYIDQLGVIYRYLKVRVHTVTVTVVNLDKKILLISNFFKDLPLWEPVNTTSHRP